MNPPDLIIVLADQWRGQDQGWAGNQEVRTPRLDALAAAGVAVTGARANHPVCTPSRGDLLTGQLPHTHGAAANDLPMRDDLPTLGTALRAAGYRTGWIGKWHLDGIPRDAPVSAGRGGFEEFWSTNCSHRYLDGHLYHSVEGTKPERIDFVGYEPQVQTELACAFLDRADDRPAALVVSYGPPHDPYPDVPAEYRERYKAVTLTPRPTVGDEPEHRERLAQYYAGISAIDDQLGRLVDHLTATGRLENTLVVITSDHGDLLDAHGRRAKQVPYAEAVSVPLVLHWPLGLAPSRPDGFIGVVDLAPTLLDLLDIDPLPDSYGRSFAPQLRAGASLRERVLLGNLISVDEGYRQGVGEWRGFVDAAGTYARMADGTPWLLFDDATDPFQSDDLAARAAAGDAIARRRLRQADAELDRLLAEAGDREWTAEQLVHELDAVDAWDRRERAMHGAAGRVLGRVDADR